MKKYLVALDQGTTSSRAIVFDRSQQIVASAQKEFPQLYPQAGWVEHDPLELYSSQYGGLSKEPAICTKIRNLSTFSRALCYTGRKHAPAFPGPRGGTPYDDRSAQRPACAGPRRGAGA